MTAASLLFQPFQLKGINLKNRVTMTPLFLGYAGLDGAVNQLLLDHYREMAASEAAMIVVENAIIDPSGLGSPFTIRVNEDGFIPGLTDLARTIKSQGAAAFQQINHTGRYAFGPEKLAASTQDPAGIPVKEMTREDINRMIRAYASAAGRVKAAGFDGVEIHGGTGYLLVQFLSPRTNQRRDEYGGSLANRMRFPLQVVEAVLDEVGQDYPVGYRFLADELLPDGLGIGETSVLARELKKRGLAYLSVMAGTYDSFLLPEYIQKEREQGYMVSYAEAIKKAAPGIPIITAGRIQKPETAEQILQEKKADLIGLARILFADPLWPQKARNPSLGPIVACEPTCSLCMKRLMSGKPAFCAQWSKERREGFLKKVGEKPEELPAE